MSRVRCPHSGCGVTTGFEAEMDAHVLTSHPPSSPVAEPDGGHVWQRAEPGGLNTCRCGMFQSAYYAHGSASRRPCPLVAVPPAEAADECPWPDGTVLAWPNLHAVFQRHGDLWFSAGMGTPQTWKGMTSLSDRYVQLVPSSSQTPAAARLTSVESTDSTEAGTSVISEAAGDSTNGIPNAVYRKARAAAWKACDEEPVLVCPPHLTLNRVAFAAVDAVWTAALSHVQEETERWKRRFHEQAERGDEAAAAIIRLTRENAGLREPTCAGCGTTIPLGEEFHRIGHGGRWIGVGDSVRAAREGAVACGDCYAVGGV